MRSMPWTDDDVHRILSDDIIREKAKTYFRGEKIDYKTLTAGCRHAAMTLKEYRSDAKIRSEIEKLYNLCNNALFSASTDIHARHIADYCDGLSYSARFWLEKRFNGRNIMQSLCLRSYETTKQKKSIEQLRSLTMMGGSMVLDRKRAGRPIGRDRSIKFSPILNAPSSKRGQPPPEDIRTFVMWMRVAYFEATGKVPPKEADHKKSDSFIDFMKEILELLNVKKADLVRATNHLEALRQLAEKERE